MEKPVRGGGGGKLPCPWGKLIIDKKQEAWPCFLQCVNSDVRLKTFFCTLPIIGCHWISHQTTAISFTSSLTPTISFIPVRHDTPHPYIAIDMQASLWHHNVKTDVIMDQTHECTSCRHDTTLLRSKMGIILDSSKFNTSQNHFHVFEGLGKGPK